MSGQGGAVAIAAAHTFPDLPDSELCSFAYPLLGADFGTLCNEADHHAGHHRALAVVAGAYRRYVVWAQDGTVLPDEETSPAGPQGQTPPSEGDRVT
ncbi:hypothetical protein ACH4TP_37885 [Streptomyces sp. NPDC021012]|uniref:hypothetical protein n=1 Tax=Streptomyces sp. NPDC021012 TaxID=3365107 RepID=UPI00378B33F4